MALPNKVFVLGRYFPDSFARNVAVTLEKMGVQVGTLPQLSEIAYKSTRLKSAGEVAKRVIPAWRRWLSYREVKRVSAFRPDLVLSLTRELDPWAVDEIRARTKALVVHWYADSICNVRRDEIVNSLYNAVFLKDRETAQRLRSLLGDRFHYLPEAMNPLWHKPVEPSPRYHCDVGIAGNMYPYRCCILELLMGYDLKIWGPQPPRWLNSAAVRFYTGEYVAEHTKAQAFSSTKVSLNTFSLKEGNSMNCRAFEIAGCGGYQVMDYRPIVQEYFEPDKEVLLYRCFDELKEHIDRGLRDHAFSKGLRVAAAVRARAEHTYEHRLRAMLRVLYR